MGADKVQKENIREKTKKEGADKVQIRRRVGVYKALYSHFVVGN